jgi:anti-sigma factor RsiW
MTQSTSCSKILDRISGYLDGDLDATACEAIESHCADCAACAALVKQLRETVALCRQTAAVPLPESVRRHALESVRRLLDRDRP